MLDAISPRAALADLRQAIPPVSPSYIGFASAAAAMAHREAAGGWIFIPNDSAGAVWFDAAIFTASRAMVHPAAKGNGRLI